MKQIDDIGDVAEDDLPTDAVTIYEAEIIGVQSFQKYMACIFCNAKVEIVDEKMGSCSKCDMFQPIIRCKEKLSARLYIQEGDQYLNLSAFDEQ